MSFVRSISGLRATLGDDLTPDVVVRYISAFARFCNDGPIVVGHDGRPSGTWIEQIVLGTLSACGVEARRLGMAPTPTVQMATEKSDAVGGVSITASHNPIEWNGLKFLNSDGVFLGPAEIEPFFAMVDDPARTYAPYDRLGTIRDVSDLIRGHIDAVLTLPFLDLPRLRQRKFRVVVDAVNASGSEIVPELLREMGCEVIPLYCDGSGVFPHTPEPLPENLGDLCAAVSAHHADVGIAVDPDADRLVLVDERGTPIGEEYTITQAVAFIMSWAAASEPGARPTVAVNLSTTRAVDDVAEANGGRVVRTPVGEINVVEGMKRENAVIGGEGSGGVILPMLHYGRDSLAGIAITLQHLLHHGGTLSAIRAGLPAYEIVKEKIVLREGVDPKMVLNELRARVAERTGPGDAPVRTNAEDGLRVDFARSWVHMRASNTEPILRVIAEAPTREEATRLVAEYRALVESLA